MIKTISVAELFGKEPVDKQAMRLATLVTDEIINQLIDEPPCYVSRTGAIMKAYDIILEEKEGKQPAKVTIVMSEEV